DVRPQPAKPVSGHPGGHQRAGPERALVEEFHLSRTKSVDRVRIGPGRVVRKSRRIRALRVFCRTAPEPACPAKQLNAAIRLTPGLIRVKDRYRGRWIVDQVARVARVRVGDPYDVEPLGPRGMQ